MKQFYLLIIILLSCACHSSSRNSDKGSDYEKMANKITAIVAQKIEVETGLRLCGTGGGMMNHIRMMAMSFDCFNEIDMKQGRELVVYCVNEYLSAINSNEEIRPYLIHFPFTEKDVEITIFIHKPDHRDVPMGTLSVASELDGQLVYKIRQPDPIVLKRVHEETFEEAVKILETGEPINKIRRNTRSNRQSDSASLTTQNQTSH